MGWREFRRWPFPSCPPPPPGCVVGPPSLQGPDPAGAGGGGQGVRLRIGDVPDSPRPAVPEVEVPVRLTSPEDVVPAYALPGDAGADLAIAEDLELAPLQRALVGTGVAAAIPEGYAGFVHPRSGLAHRMRSEEHTSE